MVLLDNRPRGPRFTPGSLFVALAVAFLVIVAVLAVGA
jgi:hypothetical protein